MEPPMELQMLNVNKAFGEKQALAGVSFRVRGGQALGLLGRNGAGKTTAIRILADIFRADSGQVLQDGQPINRKTTGIGYLPEERGLYQKIKVKDQLLYLGKLRGLPAREAERRALALLNELEADTYWGKKLETLSKGNQQKIQLAAALLHDPPIVILDEPFSGLDPVNAQLLKKLIVKQVDAGKAVLFSSHQMPYVEEFCAHVCVLNNGKVVLDGEIAQIKKSYPRNRFKIRLENEADSPLPAPNSPTGYEHYPWAALCESISGAGGTLDLTLRRAEDKPALFKRLAESGPPFDAIYVAEPTLEEIFVACTTEDGAGVSAGGSEPENGAGSEPSARATRRGAAS